MVEFSRVGVQRRDCSDTAGVEKLTFIYTLSWRLSGILQVWTIWWMEADVIFSVVEITSVSFGFFSSWIKDLYYKWYSFFQSAIAQSWHFFTVTQINRLNFGNRRRSIKTNDHGLWQEIEMEYYRVAVRLLANLQGSDPIWKSSSKIIPFQSPKIICCRRSRTACVEVNTSCGWMWKTAENQHV